MGKTNNKCMQTQTKMKPKSSLIWRAQFSADYGVRLRLSLPGERIGSERHAIGVHEFRLKKRRMGVWSWNQYPRLKKVQGQKKKKDSLGLRTASRKAGTTRPSIFWMFQLLLVFHNVKHTLGRAAHNGILRVGACDQIQKYASNRTYHQFVHANKQSIVVPWSKPLSEEEERPVSTRGVWFKTQVQSVDNTMFLLFKLFYSIFPVHKECTLVSTEPFVFVSNFEANYQ